MYCRAEMEEEPVRVVDVEWEEDVLRVEEAPRNTLAPGAYIVVTVSVVGNEETCPEMRVNKPGGWAADRDDSAEEEVDDLIIEPYPLVE